VYSKGTVPWGIASQHLQRHARGRRGALISLHARIREKTGIIAMSTILAYNKISCGGPELAAARKVFNHTGMCHQDAISLRSFNLHDVPIPETVLAVGRAGSGVNNIPVEHIRSAAFLCSMAPGANAMP